MPTPSYYFTLFKKFQVFDHVPTSTQHGATTPSGGFSLNDPAAPFATGGRGPRLVAGDNTPANNPLWAVLNSRAMGNAGFSAVSVGGVSWPTMPPSDTQAWLDFQVNAPAPKFVNVFADWITAGKPNDTPTGVLAAKPPTRTGGLVSGPSVFVCSKAGDTGVRPDTTLSNYWATSLIYLVDPNTGSTVTPSSLTATEYELVAVIGNRGNAGVGRYLTGEVAEARAWVMVWNSSMGPGVLLPALSNLDVNSTNGTHDVYFMRPGEYDLVGFRLHTQTVFDGLVQAIIENGMDLGGLTPSQWVHANGAHLCAKVIVRRESESWPTTADLPPTNARIAQKNLAPFDVAIGPTMATPNITWRYFMAGDPFARMFRFDDRIGWQILTLRPELKNRSIRLLLAIPARTYERRFKKQKAKLAGLEPIARDKAKELKPPFPEHVLFAVDPKGAQLQIPPLGDDFIGMALGLYYNPRRVEEGPLGQIHAITDATVPRLLEPKGNCYELTKVTIGGFTLDLVARDPEKIPDWKPTKPTRKAPPAKGLPAKQRKKR